MNDSSRTMLVGLAIAVVLPFYPGAGLMFAEEPALRLRATAMGAGAPVAPLTVELFRWSTDAERAPLLAALSAPPPAPPLPAAPPGGRAGRGGRGGRGPATPPSPLARLTAAVKAAPTFGFIWSDGPTGYSIKYAWHSASSDGERIVLVTDRRLGAHLLLPRDASGTPADSEFTVVEMRLDAKGSGEGKTSLTTGVVVDTAAQTLAVDGYASAPTQLRVTR